MCPCAHYLLLRFAIEIIGKPCPAGDLQQFVATHRNRRILLIVRLGSSFKAWVAGSNPAALTCEVQECLRIGQSKRQERDERTASPNFDSIVKPTSEGDIWSSILSQFVEYVPPAVYTPAN